MTDGTLRLDPAEREFLAYTLTADEIWPPNEALTPLLRQVPGGEVAGGPQLRSLVLAMTLRGSENEMPLELSISELWLLDSLLIRRDLRREKLPDGRPVLELAHKVWQLILEVYDSQLPPGLRREMQDADSNQDPDQDPGSIVASAEAILRSGHSEGTGEDLPPTEA